MYVMYVCMLCFCHVIGVFVFVLCYVVLGCAMYVCLHECAYIGRGAKCHRSIARTLGAMPEYLLVTLVGRWPVAMLRLCEKFGKDEKAVKAIQGLVTPLRSNRAIFAPTFLGMATHIPRSVGIAPH